MLWRCLGMKRFKIFVTGAFVKNLLILCVYLGHFLKDWNGFALLFSARDHFWLDPPPELYKSVGAQVKRLVVSVFAITKNYHHWATY